MRRRQVLALAATVAPLPYALAQTTAVQDETWTDARRNRQIPVRIRWPVGAAPSGGTPLVLFSHGLGGSRQGGGAWGEAWSAAGFAVIHVQHAGSDLDAVKSGGLGGLRGAMSGDQLLARLDDMVFTLDEVGRRQASGASRWAQVPPDRVGMSGHSFGAHTTLGMAGQSYPGKGPLAEPRLAAFAAFSPALAQSGNPQQAFAAIRRPMLCLTGTLDSDVVGNGSSPANRKAVFDALPPGQKARLVLADADHMTFGGQSEGSYRRLARLLRRTQATEAAQPRHHALVAAITTDWWRAQLLGDSQALARLAAPAGLSPADEWRQG
jgi:dienelactone hydrolase